MPCGSAAVRSRGTAGAGTAVRIGGPLQQAEEPRGVEAHAKGAEESLSGWGTTAASSEICRAQVGDRVASFETRAGVAQIYKWDDYAKKLGHVIVPFTARLQSSQAFRTLSSAG